MRRFGPSRTSTGLLIAVIGGGLLGLTPACSFNLPPLAEKGAQLGSASTISVEPPAPTSPAAAPVVSATASAEVDDAGGVNVQPTATATVSAVSSSAPNDSPCPFGEAMCDGICLNIGECECTSPCTYANGQGDCYRGGCRFKACDDGYLNCDGSLANGCEVNVALEPVPKDAILVKHFSFGGDIDAVIDANWDELPSYPLLEPCEVCSRNPASNVVPISPASNAGTRPSPLDLSGSIKIGWNQAGVWVRMFTYDDNWFLTSESEALPVKGHTLDPKDARNMDNFELLWNSFDDSQDQFTDHMLFVSADGARSEVRLEQQHTDDAPARYTQVGVSCRATYLQLSGRFLQDITSNPLVLLAGKSYGFNVALNDFDVTEATADAPAMSQRQHQIFLFPPQQPPASPDAEPTTTAQYYVGPWWGGSITLLE